MEQAAAVELIDSGSGFELSLKAVGVIRKVRINMYEFCVS